MDSKIQALTDKLYQEGVEKGEAKAAEIVAQAQAQAQEITDAAEAQAQKTLDNATRQIAERRKNNEAELKMYAAQAIQAVRTEIANLVTTSVVKQEVEATLGDKTLLYDFIVKIAQQWITNGDLVIETAQAQALEAHFAKKTKELLGKGVTIEQVGGKATSFVLRPTDGSYKVTFGNEEFENYFKELLRPALVKLLFS